MTHPTLKPVKSSAIEAYHYDPHTKALTVRYQGGATWAYDDVSLERATAFEGSASMGRYLSTEIKPNHIGRQVFGR